MAEDRRRAFRWLLGGSAVSMLGSRLTSIAYPMLVLYLHGSPMIAGLAVFAATAPSILCYPPAGVLVDRWDPRKTMMAAEIGRGIAIGTIMVMVAAHLANVWLVILMAVVEEALAVFAMLAERRLLRDLVDPGHARSAQASMEARTHVIVLFGRTLGGVLFATEAFLPFLLDALSSVISVSSLAVIGRAYPVPRKQHKKRKDRPRFSTEIRDGFRTLSSDPFARDASLLAAAMTFVCQALIIVFLAEAHTMRLGSLVIGGVLAASGLGGVLGAVVGRRLPRASAYGPVKLQPVFWSVMLLVLAITSLVAKSNVWQMSCMAIAMLVLGFTGAMGNVELDTYLTQKVPYAKLASVTGIDMQLTFAACALGPVLGGGLSQAAKGHMHGTGYAVWVLFALSALCAWFAFRKPQALMPDGPRRVPHGPQLRSHAPVKVPTR